MTIISARGVAVHVGLADADRHPCNDLHSDVDTSSGRSSAAEGIQMTDVLIIGAGDVGRRACSLLADAGLRTIHVDQPTDDELEAALSPSVKGVAVLIHDDILALRYSLAVEHLRPGIRLFVAMFDRTVREQLRQVVPNCVALSPAAISVPSIVAAVISPPHLAVCRASGAKGWLSVTVEGIKDNVPAYPIVSPFSLTAGVRSAGWRGKLLGQVRPYDAGSAVLVIGATGLVVVTLLDASLQLGRMPWPRALYEAARNTATIAAPETPGSTAHLLWATMAAVLVMGLSATFSAGIVQHLLSGRHVSLVGRRVIPRSGHVIVAGMGQVGLRLTQELRALGVAVVGIDPQSQGIGVTHARAASIPVIMGDATARRTLMRAGLRKAIAIVSVPSADRDSIAIAVAAQAVAPRTPVVIRAGADGAIQQTRSLWHIGSVIDVNGLTAAYVAQSIVGEVPLAVGTRDDAIYCVSSSEQGESQQVGVVIAQRCLCS